MVVSGCSSSNITASPAKRLTALASSLLALFALAVALSGCSGSQPAAPEAQPAPAVASDTAGDENKSSKQDKQAGQEKQADQEKQAKPDSSKKTEPTLDEDGWYYSKDEVSGYIQEYGHLPSNFITKKEARDLGWSGGSVEKFAPGMAIGGDRFGNYEGILPQVKGRTYYECDIDTNGKKSRGPKRIIYSSDGQIYYTDDHYETFTLIAGEE